LDFETNFTEQGRQPYVQPPTWRAKSLYLCEKVAQLDLQTPGSLSFAFYFSKGYGWRYSNPPPQAVWV
jgi:hypothetical protein